MPKPNNAAAKKQSTARAPNDIDRIIAAHIWQARTDRNITQDKLADLLGVSFQQIQKYENGINRISAARLYQLCKVFQVSMESMCETSKTPRSRR